MVAHGGDGNRPQWQYQRAIGSPAPALADVDRSGSVDIMDIMLVAHLIGRSAYLYDANCDGFLDVTDLATLVTAWQSCLAANTPPGQAPVACR
ncbi:hypothetical protein [Candidatus Amarolinea dominans]|uniref:hypothetical protein n=1 Tax=Candidatus Amarolinea dominans TaxID=3140696 RepID=UPI003136F6DB|nr:hypothetical protein [Anaerolineae bacterium]